MHQIVVEDPTGELPLGTVVDGPMRNTRAARSAVLMPVDPDRVAGDVTGYFLRHWGEGWLFDRGAGERGCPMLLHVEPDAKHVYWAARVAPAPNVTRPRGKLKLVTDSGRQQRAMAGGLSAVKRVEAVEALGPPDAQGGWVIMGRSDLAVSMSGMIALSLYGVCKGLLVQWSAVTQVRETIDPPGM